LGLVPRNTASAARAPAVRRPEFETWSSDDLKAFFEPIKDNRLRAAFVVLATTGMRRGEVLGMRWRDLDLDAAQLAIVQTLTTVKWEPIITQTETQRSRRTIYLDTFTVDPLRDHRRRQREEQNAAGPAWDKSHDLRHTYATLAVKTGAHPTIVSERRGHATVGITLDLYSHVTPGIAGDAAQAVASTIFE
jgi:integrase